MTRWGHATLGAGRPPTRHSAQRWRTGGGGGRGPPRGGGGPGLGGGGGGPGGGLGGGGAGGGRARAAARGLAVAPAPAARIARLAPEILRRARAGDRLSRQVVARG